MRYDVFLMWTHSLLQTRCMGAGDPAKHRTAQDGCRAGIDLIVEAGSLANCVQAWYDAAVAIDDLCASIGLDATIGKTHPRNNGISIERRLIQ